MLKSFILIRMKNWFLYLNLQTGIPFGSFPFPSLILSKANEQKWVVFNFFPTWQDSCHLAKCTFCSLSKIFLNLSALKLFASPVFFAHGTWAATIEVEPHGLSHKLTGIRALLQNLILFDDVQIIRG